MILTINCGSSTIKYQLYSADVQLVAAKGIVSRIGEPESYVEHQARGQKVRHELPVPNHHAAFEIVIQYLLHPNYGAIEDINEIQAVGHRAVHGADTFIESTLITDDVIRKLEECTPLAPLHNPANLIGIREGRALLPKVAHVAVFDTSFHQTMPPKAYVYALPYEYCVKHKIRRYGFHGTSCRYVSQRAAEILGRPLEELNMVICHLGNGVTITAVQAGRSIDTSIGFATFSGVMMVFTAGIGENSALIRALVCDGLEFLGIEVDKRKNAEANGRGMTVSRPAARSAVLVVPTDEEKMIALDTMRLIASLA